MTAGPLKGIRILDFASFIAGPYASSILAEMGADVIKIEPPQGDLARAWSPFIGGESRYFQAWNRSKRSIVLDLTDASSRPVLAALVKSADVVVENFRNGVTAKLGIDYPTLRPGNERLIYCSSTAFGSQGPWRTRPGYDPVLQCLGGAARANERFNGGATGICSVAVSDYQAAMLLSTAICAALYHRERTGQGQFIETSLLQAVMSVQSHHYIEPLEQPEEGAVGIYPYRLFKTRDDAIFVAGGTDKFWRLLCQALRLDWLGTGERFSTNARRVNLAAEFNAILEPAFLAGLSADFERDLIAAGVPCGSVKDYHDFFNSEQVTAMGMNPEITHCTAGRLRVAGLPVTFSESPGAIQRAAPLLGEHAAEILKELNL